MLTFADYMERVLYGPAGYYSTGTARSGKSGDYFTAPDVGPVFGQLLAEIFETWRAKLHTESFSIMEAGAGEGRLAADILKSHPFPYIAVERSPYRRGILKNLKEQFSSFEVCADFGALQGRKIQGVLFGNELIDAFPVHRVQLKKGRLRELFVEEKEGKKRFLWNDPSTPKLQSYLDRLGIVLPEGYETEINLAASDWLAAAADVLREGLILLIDYGRPAHEYYAEERTRGTLRAFSKHKVSADFLDPSGAVDLTADVDFTSIVLDAENAGLTPLAFMEMGTFLMQGVACMKEPNVLNPRALKYLIHPEAMGSAFHVLILGKGVQASDWIFEHNRLGRLRSAEKQK